MHLGVFDTPSINHHLLLSHQLPWPLTITTVSPNYAYKTSEYSEYFLFVLLHLNIFAMSRLGLQVHTTPTNTRHILHPLTTCILKLPTSLPSPSTPQPRSLPFYTHHPPRPRNHPTICESITAQPHNRLNRRNSLHPHCIHFAVCRKAKKKNINFIVNQWPVSKKAPTHIY